FVTWAIAAPALIVLGAPWHRLRLPTGRLVTPRQHQRSFRWSATCLLAYAGVCLVWRLPPVMDTLARHPALLTVELLTLLAAGIALWLELVNSPPFRPWLHGPPRAAIAALAMWSLWIVAYVL